MFFSSPVSADNTCVRRTGMSKFVQFPTFRPQLRPPVSQTTLGMEFECLNALSTVASKLNCVEKRIHSFVKGFN